MGMVPHHIMHTSRHAIKGTQLKWPLLPFLSFCLPDEKDNSLEVPNGGPWVIIWLSLFWH